MSQLTSMPSLYRAPINLWVEDPLTREYLQGCWQNDPNFLYLIAGGNENIAAIVTDAEDQGYSNVFGLTDRDFGASNRSDWATPGRIFRHFVMEVHEAENWLLDPRAFAGCTLNTGRRKVDEIQQRLGAYAGTMAWWMACRTVIAEVSRDFRDDFLIHPGMADTPNLATAVEWIVNQPWFTQLQAKTNTTTAPGAMAAKLNQAHAEATSQIDHGPWRERFPGKELLHHVRDWIYINRPDPNAASSERDIDLAKSVAEWQANNNAVPHEVVALRDALRLRVGI